MSRSGAHWEHPTSGSKHECPGSILQTLEHPSSGLSILRAVLGWGVLTTNVSDGPQTNLTLDPHTVLSLQ